MTRSPAGLPMHLIFALAPSAAATNNDFPLDRAPQLGTYRDELHRIAGDPQFPKINPAEPRNFHNVAAGSHRTRAFEAIHQGTESPAAVPLLRIGRHPSMPLQCPLVGIVVTALLEAIDELFGLLSSEPLTIPPTEGRPGAAFVAAPLIQTRIHLWTTVAAGEPQALETRAGHADLRRPIVARNRDRDLRHNAFSRHHFEDVQTFDGRGNQNRDRTVCMVLHARHTRVC